MTQSDGSKDLRRAAADFRHRYYGPRGNPGPPSAMAELAPEVMELVDSVVYGEIYNRPAVNLQTRSLCTIAALTVLGHSPQLIRRHIQGALHIGVTKEQISEIISQMVFYGGMPAAINAFRVAKETFDGLEGKQATDPFIEGETGAPEIDQSPDQATAPPGHSPGFSRGQSGPNTSIRTGSDEGRVHRYQQQGQAGGGQPRPPSDRPRSPARGRNQSSGDGRSVGRQSKGGRPGPRGGARVSTRPPARGGGGTGRKKNPGKRR